MTQQKEEGGLSCVRVNTGGEREIFWIDTLWVLLVATYIEICTLHTSQFDLNLIILLNFSFAIS